MVTLDRQIGSGADLGTAETEGQTDIYDLDEFGDVWLGDEENSSIWVRFPNITIPQGATIDVAYIVFDVASVVDSGTIQSNIFGIDEDDHAAPTTLNQWTTDHGMHTSASVVWDFVTGSGSTRQTPSIVSIIQEIVDRAGWQSGNDIGIHVDNDNSNSAIIAFDGAAVHIEYTEGGVVHDLEGSVSAAATVAGSLTRIRSLAGSAAGSATVAGTLIRVRDLAGAVSGNGTTTGSLTRRRALAGEVSGTATFLGSMIGSAVELVGQIVGSTTISGTLVRIRSLAGSVLGRVGLRMETPPADPITSLDYRSVLRFGRRRR